MKDECSSEVLLSGYLEIEIEFSKPLAEQHVLVVYGVSPNTMDINCEAQVLITNPIK